MLQVMILLHILCSVPGEAFPQRANQHEQGNFDFDAYLEHFAPTKPTVMDHPRSFPNQDYRYIPLIGERPDYIPPIVHRGHFPHSNIQKRVVKHRSWHSTYQNDNFPTPVFQQPPQNFVRHRPIESPGEMLHRPAAPQFSVPSSNFNFRIHSKMEDLGDYEAPVVVEEVKKEPEIPQPNEDYDFPIAMESIIKKHTADSLKRKNHKTEIIVVSPKDIATFKPKSPNFVKPSLDEYDYPVVVESLLKVGNSKLNENHPNLETSHSDFSDDYEEPTVLEALTKVKNPVHKKNSHTKADPVENKIVKIHPTMKPDSKPVDKLVSINQDDYEAPTKVNKVNVFTKGGLANSKENDKRKPISKPVRETSVYLEDYEAPEVIQEFTKKEQTLSQGKVGHKVKEHELEKEDVTVSIIKPVVPVSSEDYEAPVVVAAFKKDELDYSKGHVAHQVKKKPSDKQTKPIVKKTPGGYPDDYEAPVVLEAFTKDELAQNNKLVVKEKPIAKQDKVKLNYSSEKTSVPGHIEDYEAPIVVLPNEEPFQKENGMKTNMKHQNSKMGKDDHKEVESTEDYKTEEYDYKELDNYFLNDDADYEGLDTRNEMDQDLDDYNYEDLPKESLVQELHKSGMKHSQKPDKKKNPVKTSPEVKDNDENLSKVPEVKGDGYKASLGTSQIKKRVKREAIDDFEFPEINEFDDYQVPVIVETIKREKFVPKSPHSTPNSEIVNVPNFVEPSPDEDYEYPVIVEEFSKSDISSDMESKFASKPAHFKPNTGILISNKPPKFIQPPKDEEYESPVVVETISKVAGLSGEQAEKIPSKVHAHSNPNQEAGTIHKPIFVEQSQDEDYELPEIVETISKVTKPRDEKIPINEKPQINKDYETVIEALTKADGSLKHPPEHVMPEDSSNAYSRNKREREYSMGYQYPVYSDRQDSHEGPIDEVYHPEYESHDYQNPNNYFEEREPQHEDTSFPKNFESSDLPDNQIVLDSITINRESPDGREIPFLDVLAVDNKVDGDPDSGVKVMAFNKENGAVEVINVGHEDSNHNIESLAEPGSGDGEERSLDSRSLLPLNSNSWSFMNRIQSQERRKFKRCLTPRNETGNCMPVQMCSVPNIGNTVEELLKNVCIIDEVFIGICCPEFPVETVRVDWGQLGRPDTEPLQDKVESSEITECGKLPSTFGDKDSWPWMAPLISTTSDKVFCGGALISESYVLTAAHCTSKIPRNQILVRFRNGDPQQPSIEFAVIEIKRHAQYNPRTMQNDIALLKLSRKVPLGQFRRLVCLPNNDREDYIGDTAVLLRWQGIAEKGDVESLSVIANHECQNRLGVLVGDSILCTEPRNDEATCNADSGAPLVIEKDGRFQIIGTLTWNRNDCDGNFPSVFTRVSSFLKWIQTHTK